MSKPKSIVGCENQIEFSDLKKSRTKTTRTPDPDRLAALDLVETFLFPIASSSQVS